VEHKPEKISKNRHRYAIVCGADSAGLYFQHL